MLNELKRWRKLVLRPSSYKPHLGEVRESGPTDSPYTLLMVCRQGFNVNVPNANSTIRMGYCRAFARLGIRYRLVSALELEKELPRFPEPLVFLSVYDYVDLSAAARRMLPRYRHFIWVTANDEIMKTAYAPYGYKTVAMDKRAIARAVASSAEFVWAPVPPSGLEYYQDWLEGGNRLVSLPQACDDERYFPEPGNTKYSDVEIAFVGGYWKKKAFQFEKYLRPYEDRLTVFGYSPWPYKGYRGLLADNDERVLYQNARVSPALSEPHAEVIGDIVERSFKVLGSGGLAVTDAVPFYRELFDEHELLVPESVEHYHVLVKRALEDDEFNARYREAGYRAVQERHTYVHRARTILDLLGLKVPVEQPLPPEAFQRNQRIG